MSLPHDVCLQQEVDEVTVLHLFLQRHLLRLSRLHFVVVQQLPESWQRREVLKCRGKNGSFYIAQYPVRWTAQESKRFTLFDLPGRPVHTDTNSASPGSILARQQLRAKTKSLTFPPLSIARYSFIQLSQQGHQWRERKCPIFETVAKEDSNPGSLDCESGVLPLSYRTPLS